MIKLIIVFATSYLVLILFFTTLNKADQEDQKKQDQIRKQLTDERVKIAINHYKKMGEYERFNKQFRSL